MRYKAIVAAVCISVFASARADVTGTVRVVLAGPSSDVFLFDLNSSGPYATCNTFHRYAVSLSTVQGRAVYSLVLAAKLSGKAIQVVNTGVCNLDPYSEDIGLALIVP